VRAAPGEASAEAFAAFRVAAPAVLLDVVPALVRTWAPVGVAEVGYGFCSPSSVPGVVLVLDSAVKWCVEQLLAAEEREAVWSPVVMAWPAVRESVVLAAWHVLVPEADVSSMVAMGSPGG